MTDFREKLSKIYEDNRDSNYIYDEDLFNFIKENIITRKAELPLLYRYSKADYSNIRNLETGKLYLSEAGNMNDAFEGLSGEINDNVSRNLDKLKNVVFIKSFTELKNDLKLWSMYADNYAGMCIAYDFSKICDSYIYHLFPIIYSEKRKIKNNLNICIEQFTKLLKDKEDNNCISDFDFLKDIMSLYLIKSKSWENEREWRLVFSYLQIYENFEDIETDENDIKELYKVNSQLIDFPYAKAIYLGPKMDFQKKEHLKEIGRKLKIPVYETKLSHSKYEIEVIEKMK